MINSAWNREHYQLFANMSDEELLANARAYNDTVDGHFRLALILDILEERLKQRKDEYATLDPHPAAPHRHRDLSVERS